MSIADSPSTGRSLDVSLVPAGALGSVEPARLPWARLAGMLTAAYRTTETAEEYLAWKSAEDPRAAAAKAGRGGWVGGPFTGARRVNGELVSRTVVALDVDAPGDRMEDELKALGCAMVVHPTHTPGHWRAVMPLARAVGPDEYRRLVAVLASRVSGVDGASAKPTQLMFWPSVPADDERTAWELEGLPPLDPDGVLAPSASEPPQRRERPALELEQRSDRTMLGEAVMELSDARAGERNETLNRVAFRLAANGLLDDDSEDRLSDAARMIGLEPDEVAATLGSARKSGASSYNDRTGGVLALFDAAPSGPADGPADGPAPSGLVTAGFIEDSVLGARGPLRRTEELWAGRIPLGALTIISGRGASGKSLFTVWLAARASMGELDGALRGRPASVAFIQSEESLDEELRPKLAAAGADMGLTRAPVWTAKGAEAFGALAGAPWIPAFPADMDALAEYIEATGTRLVFLDVLTAMFAAGLSTDAQEDVRRVLSGLNRTAQATGAAIVAVNHLRKGSLGADGDEVAGSHEFRDATRCLWLAAFDKGARRTRMLQDKYNRGAPGGRALSYAVDLVHVDGLDDPVPRVVDVRDEDPAASSAGWTAEQQTTAEVLGQWLDAQSADGCASVSSMDVERALKQIPGGGACIRMLPSFMASFGWRCCWDGDALAWIESNNRPGRALE